MFVLVLAFQLLPSPVFARDLKQIQQEIAQKKEKLNELEQEINQKKNDKKAAQAVLAEYQTQFDELQGLITEKEEVIANRENDLNFKTEQISLTMEAVHGNRQLFEERLRAIYDMNSTNALGVLLTVQSYSDFVVATDAIRRISDRDTKMLKELSDSLNQYETQRQELDGLIASLNEELAGLEADREWCNTKMTEVKGVIWAADQEIKDVQSEKSATNEEINAAQAEYDRIFRELQQSSNSSKPGDESVRHEGPLAWPVPSSYQISSWFGDPRSNTGYHTGIDIRAPQGATVVAAAPGKVTKAEFHYSYGNYVVIDHGQGLRTLYAHNSALYVGVGQYVEAGQAIAAVGSTGDSTGNHLHFEVHDGAVQNPAGSKYLNI